MKGSWIVSGKTGIDFSSATTKYTAEGQSYDGTKVSTFTITPSVGYFVATSISVDVDLGFTSTKTTFKNSALEFDYEEKTSIFSILPNATYYFPTASNLRPNLGAGIGYGSLTYTDFFNDEETTKGGFLWGAKGGLLYMLNSNIGIDLGAGYNSLTTKETVDNTEVKTSADAFGVSPESLSSLNKKIR